MNELSINQAEELSNVERRRGFWRRQFADTETTAQLIFDATFGVVAPLLCLIFDPIVFQRGFIGELPILADYRLFAYAVIFIEITALLGWHVRVREARQARILGGIMLAGGIFSLVVGVVILPLSLLGLLFYGIGLFGFTPLVTAIIYLRNGRRALRYARAQAPTPGRRVAPVLLSALLSIALPALAQWRVTHMTEQAMRALTAGDTAQAAMATNRLKYIHWLALDEGYEQLLLAYRQNGDASQRARIAAAYMQLTGVEVEARARWLND
ncbi:MAG TPA: hypothetical protein VE775_09680 [Pyrinomonadaceae bacterium]|nr:hypothetical protein [Pyrinomonadaceae bacterium]